MDIRKIPKPLGMLLTVAVCLLFAAVMTPSPTIEELEVAEEFFNTKRHRILVNSETNRVRLEENIYYDMDVNEENWYFRGEFNTVEQANQTIKDKIDAETRQARIDNSWKVYAPPGKSLTLLKETTEKINKQLDSIKEEEGLIQHLESEGDYQ